MKMFPMVAGPVAPRDADDAVEFAAMVAAIKAADPSLLTKCAATYDAYADLLIQRFAPDGKGSDSAFDLTYQNGTLGWWIIDASAGDAEFVGVTMPDSGESWD